MDRNLVRALLAAWGHPEFRSGLRHLIDLDEVGDLLAALAVEGHDREVELRALELLRSALDSDEIRRIEQVVPSTFNETTMPGSRYITSTGTPRPESPPVGPVNTPRQDEIDALNRAWRASGDEPS